MQKLLYEIVNLADELFSFVDTGYVYREVNQAYLRLFGTTREAYVGKHLQEVMGKTQFLTIKTFIDRAFLGEKVTYERWFEFKDKERYFLHVSYTPYVSQGSVLGVIVSAKDMTQKRLLEEERQQTQTMLLHYAKLAELGSMASFLNHQWRAPLNTLGSHFLRMGILADAYGTNTPLHESLERCEEIVEEIAHSLDQFRSFYTPNDKIQMIFLEPLVHKVLHLLEDRIHTLDVAVMLYKRYKGSVRCYASDLMHVLMIVINNALDAFAQRGTEHPSLDITLKKHKERIFIIVQDNAGGMDKEVKKEVFKRFVSTKSEKEGSGMGLFFGKIVMEERLNGKLHLQNGAHGVRVSIEIPC